MTSPTRRTLELLRKDGWKLVEVVEHWNSWASVRKDLFGFIDVIAISNDQTLGVQVTSAANVSARIKKMLHDPEIRPRVVTWCQGNRTLEVHGWGKRKNRWECRKVIIANVLGELISVE